jgi:hypothetical protein
MSEGAGQSGLDRGLHKGGTGHGAQHGSSGEGLDRAFHRGEQLPPVSLYKVGSFYFVLDGHHRLSVASYHGAEWVDAEVTEFGARLSKARGRANEQPKRGEPNMYQWLPPQLWRIRRAAASGIRAGG